MVESMVATFPSGFRQGATPDSQAETLPKRTPNEEEPGAKYPSIEVSIER